MAYFGILTSSRTDMPLFNGERDDIGIKTWSFSFSVISFYFVFFFFVCFFALTVCVIEMCIKIEGMQISRFSTCKQTHSTGLTCIFPSSKV